jgi:hypothetical protein
MCPSGFFYFKTAVVLVALTMFRTTLTPYPLTHPIAHQHRLLTIGSCFSDSIGARLTEYKFTCSANPFGVIYNPSSIHKAVLYAIHNQLPADPTFLTNQGIHLNYDFHSTLGALFSPELKKMLTEVIGNTHYFLKATDWLVITYGTSWVYTRRDTGDIVANCHKMPSPLFKKELYTQKKLIESFSAMHRQLMAFNPNLRILLTVSPVRHIKDSLELNSVSKAILRLGCHTLTELHENVYYFPSYEIMMDDLRDYRFYKPDMIHPSLEAEEYIWHYFSSTCFDESTKKFIPDWMDVLRALRHKAFHPASTAHQHFLKETLKKLDTFGKLFNVEAEREYLKKQLL